MAEGSKKFSRKEMKQPDEFLKRSREVSEWVGAHARQILVVTICVIVIAFVGAIVWSYLEGGRIKASRTLDKVFEVAGRAVVPTEYSPGQEYVEDSTFGSQFHKDEVLLQAYKTAREEAKETTVKKLATLGIAATLLGLERYKEASKEYESLLKDPAGMEGLMGLAYEGLGFAYEGMGKTDKALKKYRALESVNGGAYRELGLYHQARLLEAQGKKEEAIKLRKQISTKINEATEMTPLLAYLQERIAGKEGVEAAPAFFKGGGAAAAPGGEITPELIEDMKKRLEEIKKKQESESAAAKREEKGKESSE